MWHKWQNPTFTKDVQKSRFSLKKKKQPKNLSKKQTKKQTNQKTPKKQNYLANNLKSLKQYPVSQ